MKAITIELHAKCPKCGFVESQTLLYSQLPEVHHKARAMESINCPSCEPRHTAALVREESGGTWGNHSNYPVEDWGYEVSNDETRLGYWEWVAAKIENEG